MLGSTRGGGAALLEWLARRPWALRGWSGCYNAIRLAGRPDHRRRVRSSRRVLRRIRGFKAGAGAYPRALCYLRRVDPLVFEEIVLSALESAGAFVIRNRRYSGDGGSDGAFWVRGVGWLALQMKRYGAHISRADVACFVRMVERRRGLAGGIFVHTGRTGAGSVAELRGTRISLLSGRRLLELLLDGRLPLEPGLGAPRIAQGAPRRLGSGREPLPRADAPAGRVGTQTGLPV